MKILLLLITPLLFISCAVQPRLPVASIQQGMSEADVYAMLGSPYEVRVQGSGTENEIKGLTYKTGVDSPFTERFYAAFIKDGKVAGWKYSGDSNILITVY